MLRQGISANEVALYLPNADAWARFTPGRVSLLEALGARLGPSVIARILEAGYGLDLFDEGALEHIGRYRIVVLPVVVGNLALNHMAGRPLPDYRLLNLRYGVRFEAQDMDKVQPVPSGLLGPIRLGLRPLEEVL